MQISEEIDKWAIALWEYYSNILSRGQPFYLAADSNLINKIGHNAGLSSEIDMVAAFHAACNQSFAISKVGARVKSDTYKQREYGFSRIICLAVQQVLVVEQLLRDPQYSEAEYFPRYRKYIGVLGGIKKGNPLKQDFEKIWHILSDELGRAATPRPFLQTFSRGGSRKNQTTNYPLSQALFTTEDLLRIQKETVGIITPLTPNKTTFQALREISRTPLLGSRARNLIRKCSNEETESSLCEQVKSFATSLVLSEEKKRAASKTDYLFFAERNEEDFFSEDKFEIYIQNKDGKASQLDVFEELDVFFDDFKILVLAFRNYQYSQITAIEPLIGETKAVVVVPAHSTTIFQKEFDLIYGAMPKVKDSNISSRYTIFFCQKLDERLCLKFGGPVSKEPQKQIFELVGGIKIDSRSDAFLVGYPPNSFSYQDWILSDETTVLMDGRELSAKSFFASLHEIRDYKSYSIFVQDQAIEFALVSQPLSKKEHFDAGFRLDGNELEPFVDSLSEDEVGLRGTAITVGRFDCQTDNTEIGDLAQFISKSALVGLIRPGRKFRISDAAQQVLLPVLKQLRHEFPIAAMVAQRIEQSNSIVFNGLTRELLEKLQVIMAI